MTTRSVTLWAASLVGRPTGTVFICPIGDNTILKSIYFNVSVLPVDLAFYLTRQSVNVYLLNTTLEAGGPTTGRWDGWLVLQPDDHVSCAYTAGQIASWGSGALLPVPTP